MREKFLLFIIFCIPFFTGAQEKTEKQFSTMSMDLEMGKVFQLDQNSVKFIKVISDSRCPKQVLCVWAGEAKVLLGITTNGKYFEKEVIVSGGGTVFALTEDLRMEVSHLRPYPETGAGIPAEEYCLRFAAVFPEEN